MKFSEANWAVLVEEWIALAPTRNCEPTQRERVIASIQSLLQALMFDVSIRREGRSAPLIVASSQARETAEPRS